MTYDQRFFDGIREGIKRSAESLVPLLVSELSPAIESRSMIDVGAGEGHWLWEFSAWDFEVSGYEGSISPSAHPRVMEWNLEKSWATNMKYGLALCLEVAEHLTPERGPSFIADLCKLSDLIVFSAAIPGQRGVNHLNEQWIDYWANLFLDNEFDVSGAMRWMIWNDPDIEPWYIQNLLIATKHPEKLPNLFATPLSYPWPVVHPRKWAEHEGVPKP